MVASLVPEIAHQMGLIPLAWTMSLHHSGRRLDYRWFLIALAFAMSWIADWVSHVAPAYPLGPLYLVPQAGLIVWALTAHAVAWQFLALLVATLNSALLLVGIMEPDILMHTIAWLGLLGICWSLPLIPALRWTLLLAFGLGLLGWWSYVLCPGWWTWGIYQAIRAAGIVGFCRASRAPLPFQVARARA